MKKNLIILAFVFGLFIFLFGCLGEQPTCNKPYILVGTACCLDANDNLICDTDEMQPTNDTSDQLPVTNQTENGTQDTETGPDTVPSDQLPVPSNDTQDTEPETQLCNPPYYEYKLGDCCLDTNTNNICDLFRQTKQARNRTLETEHRTPQTLLQQLIVEMMYAIQMNLPQPAARTVDALLVRYVLQILAQNSRVLKHQTLKW
jgi:hypothetical protein